MKHQFTHAHGWITPDQHIICCDASRVWHRLFQHNQDLHDRSRHMTAPEFTQSVYNDGYTRVGLYRDTLLFEHGVDQTPVLQLMREWTRDICRSPGLVTHDTHLYQLSRHDLARRKRHFQDISASR